jgi:hypothetical protein
MFVLGGVLFILTPFLQIVQGNEPGLVRGPSLPPRRS